jgi:hypothetical protein
MRYFRGQSFGGHGERSEPWSFHGGTDYVAALGEDEVFAESPDSSACGCNLCVPNESSTVTDELESKIDRGFVSLSLMRDPARVCA